MIERIHCPVCDRYRPARFVTDGCGGVVDVTEPCKHEPIRYAAEDACENCGAPTLSSHSELCRSCRAERKAALDRARYQSRREYVIARVRESRARKRRAA